MKEYAERLYVIERGLSQYTKVRLEEILGKKNLSDFLTKDLSDLGKTLHVYNPAKDPKEVPTDDRKPSVHIKSADTIETVQSTASSVNIGKQSPTKYSSVKEKIETIGNKEIPKIELSKKDKELLRKLEREHEEKIKKQSGQSDDKPALRSTSAERKEYVASTQAVNSEDKANVRTKQIPRPEPNIKPRDTVGIRTLSIIQGWKKS